MAQKKSTKTQSSKTAKKAAARTTKTEKQSAKAKRAPDAGQERAPVAPAGLAAQLAPFILLVAAVFYTVCLFAEGVGVIGNGLRTLSFGLFGAASYTVPLYLLLAALMWRADSEHGMIAWKALCYAVAFTVSAMLLHFFAGGLPVFSPVQHYRAGVERMGGGVLGGVLGELMMRGFGQALSLVLLFAMLFVFVLLMFGITPRGLWVMAVYKVKMSRERARAYALENPVEEKTVRRAPKAAPASDAVQTPAQLPLTAAPETAKKHKNFDLNVNVEEDYESPLAENEFADAPAEETVQPTAVPDGVIDEKIFEEVMRRTQERLVQNGAEQPASASEENLPADGVSGETITAERTAEDVLDSAALETMTDDELDLSAIFTEESDAELLRRLNETYIASHPGETGADTAAEGELELSVERRQLTETRTSPALVQPAPEMPAPAPAPEYVFPPIDLLDSGEGEMNENVADELRENAAKLVETLKNFNVRTKIVDVCRGPTITRYELLPEPGTRVRSIANLVDDSALNLATSGVRIEAPIPGKAAVGIEVPNKNAATVHLRTLIENPRFAAAKSRITSALGQDVAGTDVFLDVAKMPHLLIAGSTGTGKSVCINSLIVSLLYKAKPDELKLIMVDPKKVELNIYNGIPHLYMPVVSDPKKAAGALSWAVSEMERRYSLIEEVGVRDIKTYNEVTKNDPEYEFLPQFVIIIDELADLMMTAKNDVEESICRIAQKARAAGMHLIIGTQRPSVDVITGLIKANFPSRISFRVSSQIDSRTIIDRAGAETLVGRGDMLYNPVGASKPMRVQGAYVSEEDVEKIVDFIKTHNGGAEYNSSAIAEVERNAASIGAGKKGVPSGEDGDDGIEDDPMLRPAIELAVESGKISTSLIQRRLSLGYGRAAKLIDRMEQLGYVSAPEGQKPREVLITKEQFMEMVLRDTDS